MLRCMTSAIAGLKSNMTGLDVVGNNISNVNTNSFKSSSVSFRDSMYQELIGGSAGSDNAAGINPSQVGYGSTASSIDINTTKGGQDATGEANDVYIDGDGYFIIGNSAKGDGTNGTTADAFTDYKYTRLGTMGWDSNGYLTDGDGNYVCGYSYDTASSTFGTTLTALKMPAGSTNASIASDGTITYTASDGKISTLGKIVLATFLNPGGLEQIGGNFYTASKNSGTETDVVPGTNSTNKLVTGALEASNVDLATEFSNMIIYERGYQANTKIVTVADECLQTLVNMK
jgi:flagellar hook protein FlgE